MAQDHGGRVSMKPIAPITLKKKASRVTAMALISGPRGTLCLAPSIGFVGHEKPSHFSAGQPLQALRGLRQQRRDLSQLGPIRTLQ
jgi:hypothetical protein